MTPKLTILAALCLLSSHAVLGQSALHPRLSQEYVKARGYIQLRYTDVNKHASTVGIRLLKAQLLWKPVRSLRIYSQLAYLYGTHNIDDNRIWMEDMWGQINGVDGRIRFGQFKPSFGLENMQSATSLATMDRATASTNLAPDGGLTHSFGRDIGVQYQSGSRDKGQLTIGIFAGTGSGAESPLQAAGLLCLHGIKKWKLRKSSIQFGLSASFRHDGNVNFSHALPSTTALYTAHFHGNDQRLNAELLAVAGAWRFQSEVTYAKFVPGSGSPAIEANGAYAELTCQSSRRLELVLKAETFDPDSRLSVRDTLHGYTMGFAFLPSKRTKVMLDYVIKSEKAPNLIQVQYQRTF